MTQHIAKSVVDAYARKDRFVALLPKAAPEMAHLSVAELEELRLRTPPTSASRHGLETICGASCETGAQ